MRFSPLFRFGLDKSRDRSSVASVPSIDETGMPLILTHAASGVVSGSFGDANTLGAFNNTDFDDQSFADRVHLLDRVAFLQALDDACTDGKSSTLELRFRSKGSENGGWIWLACHVFPTQSGPNNSVLARARYENISHIKQLQSELARVEDELIQLKTDHTATVSQIGHQLGNSLQAIMGNAELLQLESNEPNQRLEHIIGAAQELHYLADEFRQNDSTPLEHLVAKDDDFSWSELINEITSLIAHPAKTRGVQVEIDAVPSLPDTNIEKRSANLVLSHIMKEMIAASPQNSSLTIRARQFGPKIRTELAHSGSKNLAPLFEDNFLLSGALKKLGGEISENINGGQRQLTLVLPIKSNSHPRVGDQFGRNNSQTVDKKGEYRARLSA